MAEGKEFEMLYRIKGALDATFSGAFAKAQKAMSLSTDEMRRLNRQSAETRAKIGDLTAAQARLTGAMAANDRLYQKQLISLKQYEANQARLRGQLDNVTAGIKKQEAALAGLAAKQKAAQGRQMEQLGAKRSAYGANAIQAGMLAFSLSEPIRDAMKFESVMADVKKVVDFDSPQQFKQMGNDILQLSKELPMTAEEIGQIVAAGGQAGIEKENLLGFAKAAAQMGVAFDIPAEQAGNMMAQWRTAFKMGQSEVETLADKINYLGNNSAANAMQISDVVTRIGPLGAVGGVASGEIAALGASIAGVGIPSEVAATGIKNLVLGLSAGAGATKSQAAAFESLGLDARDMAQKMQTDAKGAILQVLEALQKVDGADRPAILSDLFGKESIGAIAPLLNNLDALKKNLDMVGPSGQYAGSMIQEFKARAATTENQVKLLKNGINAASIAIGSGMLPAVNGLATGLIKAADFVGKLAAEHPTLTTAILGTAIGAVGLAAAFNGAMWVITGLKMGVVGFKAIMNAFRVIQIACTIAQWAWNGAMAVGLWPVLAIIAVIGALIAIGYVLIKNWDTVKQWFITLWNDPKQAIDDFVSGARNVFDGLINWLSEKWNWIKSIFSSPIKASVQGEASGNGKATQYANARGGIYAKGAFTTSFAEESDEAAIPIDGSSRAVALWHRTGELLGVAGKGGGTVLNAPITVTINGNADSSTVAQIEAMIDRKVKEILDAMANRQRRVAYD